MKNYKVVISLNEYDLEHKLLRGSSLFIDSVPTYKITLGQMADYGFTKMQSIISLLCMDDDKINDLLNCPVENPSVFLFIVVNMLREYEMIESKQINPDDIENTLCVSVPSFLMLLFKKDVLFDQSCGFIVGSKGKEEFILNSSNYDKLRTILKERNCLLDSDTIGQFDNPNSDMAKKLLEKRKKLREKIKKSKIENGNDDGLTMADLISIFAEAENMPLQNVYDNYDIYQFNNQFNRLKIMDDFHVNIQALLAGAKKDEVKLQHWLSKIKKQED